MRSTILILLAACLIIATGCSGGGGGGSSSGGTPPPTTSVADFAATWTVVIDGNLHATVGFNAAGTMTANSAAGWTSGSVVVGSGSAFTINEVAGAVTTTLAGTLALDKKTMAGTYTRSGGSPSSGAWCATLQGQSYLTNADLVGAWAFTTNGSSYTTITYGADGTVSAHGNPDYIAASGRLSFLGGLALRYTEQVQVSISGTPTTVTRTFSGTMVTGKASMSGTYSGTNGSSEIQSGPWSAARPIGLSDLAKQWEVLRNSETSTGSADWGFNADGTFNLLQDPDAIVAQSSAAITADYRVVITIKRNGSAPGEIITVVYTGTLNAAKDQMDGTYTATSSAGGGTSGTWTAHAIPSGSG